VQLSKAREQKLLDNYILLNEEQEKTRANVTGIGSWLYNRLVGQSNQPIYPS
jgi:hypothetical protein